MEGFELPNNMDFSAINFHNKYPFKALDEYSNPTSKATGGHFDILFKNQTEQWSRDNNKIVSI
jgi:hypothetical protein